MSDDVAWKMQAERMHQNMNMASLVPGGPGQMTEEEHRLKRREAEVQQAIYVLDQARTIRADAALMAEVRSHIRRMRDESEALLADLGE